MSDRREYYRQWRLANLEKARASYRRWRAANPEKARAIHRVAMRRLYSQDTWHRARHLVRCAANGALKVGKLSRKPCEVCGAHFTEFHHDDYLKPLEVRHLCTAHHREEHQQRKKT